MNHITSSLSIMVLVTIGIGLSVIFVADHFGDGPVTNIDPKISEFYADFALQSNTYVYSVKLADDFPSIILIVDRTPDGHVIMDDPLPLFQELYPDENVTTLAVLAGGNEIPYTMENNTLRFGTGNKEILLIRGE